MIIHNLPQLISGDFHSMAHFGRAIYKYTDCGPWVAFRFQNGKELCYEDPLARAPHTCRWPWVQWVKQVWNGVRPSKCIGLLVGSIIEGHDYEVGPMLISFPFEEEEMYNIIERVDKGVDDYLKENDDLYNKLQDEENCMKILRFVFED